MAQDNQSGPPSEYTDRPEITETFVDYVEDCGVFGAILKMTLSATRYPQPKIEAPLIGDRRTAARLVMPIETAFRMYEMLDKMTDLFEEQGLIVKATTRQPRKLH